MRLEEAVLVAIMNGAHTVKDVAEALSLTLDDAKRIIDNLKLRGYVKEEIRGWWIFKRRELRLTEKGLELASKAFDRLKELASKLKESILKGDEDYVNEFMNSWGYIVPLILWMNLIDLALLTPLLPAYGITVDSDGDVM